MASEATQCMVWGRGEDGSHPCQMVRTGSENPHHPEATPASLKAVSKVACGGKHSIVVTAHGEVYTWGWNWHGQLGHGDVRDQLLAQPVRGIALARALTQAHIVSVAAGKEHSIALTNTGSVYSWGGGREGQLGGGEEDISQPIPRLITKFHAIRVTMLSASGDHSLVLAEGGVVYSWGKGANGRLGHGDLVNCSSPTIVKALTGIQVTTVACGWSHSLAVCAQTSETNNLYAWGKGDSGQLGLGDRLDRLVPTEICLASEFRAADDAAIRTITSFQPLKVVSVAAGYFHTGLVAKHPNCASTWVYTWGWGEHGQLGHGGVEDEVLPRAVTSLQTLHITQMACGGAHSMVITNDSECYGFGNAEFGQLGFIKNDTFGNEADDHGQLNSTNDELRILTGSDKLCAHPTRVFVSDYKVMHVACGWWHTVAIVLNHADITLSPPPAPVFHESDLNPLTDDFVNDKDTDINLEDSDSELPTTNWFGRLFRSRKDVKDKIDTTVEWGAILMNWEDNRTSKRARRLWRQGVPPDLRKSAWTLALGLRHSSQFDEIMHEIHTNRASNAAAGTSSETARLISLDVPRTYPLLSMFQKDCSLHQPLHDLLEAVAWNNPSIGYCQGMSYLGSTLLMYMDTSMAFMIMNALIQHPLLSALYTMNVPLVVQHVRVFEHLLAKHLPQVYENFCKIGITSDQYMIEWLMTLFSRALPLEISHRLWDCFILEGEIFLFRAIVGILQMDKQTLETGTFEQCLVSVKAFKEVDARILFKRIFSVKVPQYLVEIIDRIKIS